MSKPTKENRPEGYQPPQSTEELLQRYSQGERYFQKIDIERAELREAELSDTNLIAVSLPEANLEKANLKLTTLGLAKLQKSNLQQANLQQCILTGADLSGALLKHADLRDSELLGTILQDAQLDGANLSGAKMQNANCQRANFDNANLQEANLQNINLQRASLISTNLQGANLQRAQVQKAGLIGANLERALLNSASFGGSELLGACLKNAKLSGANFLGAGLSETNIEGANFFGASLEKADLSAANIEGAYLNKVNLCGASLKGAQGTPRNREGCRLDFSTYKNSCWKPDQLSEWENAGALIINLHEFPLDARQALLGLEEGLTLFFNTALSDAERYILDGLRFGVLGFDTKCRVAKIENRQTAAIVHLQSPQREDLEKVAEALYQRIWQHKQAIQEQTIQLRIRDQALQLMTSQLAQVLVPEIARHLDEVRDNKLVRGELREILQGATTPDTTKTWDYNQATTYIHIGDNVGRDKVVSNNQGQVGVQALGEDAQANQQGPLELTQQNKAESQEKPGSENR